jgi:hypothetical protein
VVLYFLERAGLAMRRKAILKSMMKTRRKIEFTAESPSRWLLNAVL